VAQGLSVFMPPSPLLQGRQERRADSLDCATYGALATDWAGNPYGTTSGGVSGGGGIIYGMTKF